MSSDSRLWPLKLVPAVARLPDFGQVRERERKLRTKGMCRSVDNNEEEDERFFGGGGQKSRLISVLHLI